MSSATTTPETESRDDINEYNRSERTNHDSHQFVPNPGRRTTLLSGPTALSPTGGKDSIVGRQDVGPGQFQYLVSRRVSQFGDSMVLEKFAVAPEDILEHVSAAELEKFESSEAREERRKAAEMRRTKLEYAQTQLLQSATNQRQRGSKMARRSVTPSSNDAMPRSSSQGKRTAPSVSKPGPKRKKKEKEKKASTRTTSQYTSEDEIFEVEAIVDHAEIRGKRSFLVKWAGYADEENTWLPERELIQNAADLVQGYLQNKREKYEIDRLVEHTYDSDGELFFKVQWKGYVGEDTWEPESELPPSLVQGFLSSKSFTSTFMQNKKGPSLGGG